MITQGWIDYSMYKIGQRAFVFERKKIKQEHA